MPRKRLDTGRFIAGLKKLRQTSQAPVVTLIANRGGSPFEILVSTVLSLRTKDEVTSGASARLFKKAKTPKRMLALSEKQIADLIYPVGFYPTKAKQLRQISRILMEKYGGRVPDDLGELLALPGVGRKTANLVLIEAFGQDAICVDTHVHRISNRVGMVITKTVEETENALKKRLPQSQWKTYNELLVSFGQTICGPVSPFCSHCPFDSVCPKKNVNRSR